MAATQPSDTHTNSNDRSVVVLKTSDVRIRGNDVFMPITIVMSQIKKPENEQFKKVEITKEMTERDVEAKLLEKFPYLRNQRFYCAAAVDNRTRLDFNGDRRIWNGSLIKRLLRGNSALYIFVDEQVPGYANMAPQSEASSRSAVATATQNRVDLDATLVTSLHSLPTGSSVHRESHCLTQPAQSTFCVSSVRDSPKKWQDAASPEQLITKRPPEQMTTAENEPIQTFKKLRATKGVSNNTERNVAGDLNARTPLRALGTARVQGRVSEIASRSYQTEGHLQSLSYGNADMKESAHVPAQFEPLSFVCHPNLAIEETTNTKMAIPSHPHPMTMFGNVPVKFPAPQMNSSWTSEHDNHVLLQLFSNWNSPLSNPSYNSATQVMQPVETDTHSVNQDLNPSASSRRWASSDKIAVSPEESVLDDMLESSNFYLGESDSSDSEIYFSDLIALSEMDDSELTSLLLPSGVDSTLTAQASSNVGLHNQNQRENTIQMPEPPDAMQTQVSHGTRGNNSDSGLGSQSSSSAPQSRDTSDTENCALEEYRIIKMHPDAVGLSGAPSCVFLGLAELFPEIQSGYATVGDLKPNIRWRVQGGKDGEGDCIPPSPEAGKKLVQIYSVSGEKLAEAELLYVDPCHHKDEECRKRVVRNVSQDDNELVSLIRDLLRNCSRNQATIENSGNRDSGNFGSSRKVQLLWLLINEAAESGFKWDILSLLELVATNHEHENENLALYLEEIAERYARDLFPEGPERSHWSELLAAISASHEQDEESDAREAESRQLDGRNDSDSSYYGDVESLSCDSSAPTSDSEDDFSEMLSKGIEKETHDWSNTVLKESIFSDRTFQVRYRPVTALSGGLISLKEINSRGKRNKNQPILKENDTFQINEHDLHHWINLLSIPTEDIPRHLSTMHERLITQIQFNQYPAEKTQRWLSVTLQRMLLDPTEGGTTRFSQSAVAVESNSDQDMESLYADDDISIQNEDATLRRLLNHPVNLCHCTVFEIWMLACLYGPSRKTLFVYVANRKDVFPPETWFKDEDCQLWIESWNWQRCKNISLTEKVKMSQEHSGASTCVQWKGITWWDKEFDAFLRYKIDPNSQKQFKLRNRAVNQQRKLQDDPEVKLSRTKAAYLQREIGTSSKTENFANRLGKYEAYNNLAAAQHSPKDCVTATDDYKRNRKTAKERGDIWGEGTVYGNLGTAHDYLGDRKAVVVYHEPHLKNVQVLGDMSGEETACGYLGNVCLEYFKRAKDYCEHHQDQIKKWCGEIFDILIFLLFYVVIGLSSLVLCSVLFRFDMFYFGTPLVLSFVLLLCFVALQSVYIWPRKGGRRNIKCFLPGIGKIKGYIHINY